MRLRRLCSLAIAVGLALGLVGTADLSAEAAVLRAKITWQFETGDAGCPASVKDRARADPFGTDKSPYRFCKDNTITRQSNLNAASTLPDPNQPPAEGQVVESAVFCDRVTFVSTRDVKNAVIFVQQETYGQQKAVHVRIRPTDQECKATDDLDESSAATSLTLDGTDAAPALVANRPIQIDVISTIPRESQIKAPNSRKTTRRIFTSVVTIKERVGTGAALTALNRPLIVRTELQLNAWKANNA